MGTAAGYRALEMNYQLAFAKEFSKTLLETKKFRYIHLSGAATERDRDKALWFKNSMRKVKVTASRIISKAAF
jgi:hypothetical protein